jgi:hypothetical protein
VSTGTDQAALDSHREFLDHAQRCTAECGQDPAPAAPHRCPEGHRLWERVKAAHRSPLQAGTIQPKETHVTTALTNSDPIAIDVLAPREVTARLGRYIVKEHPEIDQPLAEQLIIAAAVFQSACAQNPAARLAPSRLVDIGWHAWLMHTVDNAILSQVIGCVVHHVPTEDGKALAGDAVEARQRTLSAITGAGYTVDHVAWPPTAIMGECSQCHAGCSDSPNGGKGK